MQSNYAELNRIVSTTRKYKAWLASLALPFAPINSYSDSAPAIRLELGTRINLFLLSLLISSPMASLRLA